MKWYDDKFSESSSLILPSLYKVSEDIYDEITEISDTECLYRKKCGITKYIENHGFKNFVTNGEYIIYELPVTEQTETVISKKELMSFSDDNTTVLFGNTDVSFDFEVDRRYKEYREQYSKKYFGMGIPISEDCLNLSNGIKVYEIKATHDNVSTLNINGVNYQLPTVLMTGDRLVWEEANKSYIYYPADINQDFRYIKSNCIIIDSLESTEYATLNSEGQILEITHDEKTGTNEVSVDRINDVPVESVKIQGDFKAVGKLPFGYQELDRVSSSITGANGNPLDTPYIVTDYYPDVKKTNLEIRFKPTNKIPEYGCVYGAYTDFAKDCYMFIYQSTETGFRVSGSTDNVREKLILNDVYTIKCGDGYLDVVDETNSANSFSATLKTYDITGRISCPAVIGARRKGTSFENNKSPLMDLYYIKVFEETTLVHEYIPCANPDGIIGVYDTVDKKFLSSSNTKTYNGGDIVSTGGMAGLGGKIGDEEYSFSIEESVNGVTKNVNINLSSPLFDGESLDLTTGKITKCYRIIDSYNGEDVGNDWYSSTGKLETGAIIIYKVSNYTETITSNKNVFSNVIGTHTYSLLDNIYELECPITIKYDSTDYQDFKYVIDYDNTKTYGISEFIISGSETGVGTKDGNEYKLTIECSDINNKNNKKYYNIKLDKILHSGEKISLSKEVIDELDFWTVADNVKIRFSENTEEFNIKYVSTPNFLPDNEVLISVPYKIVRALEKPSVLIDMNVGSGKGYGSLAWNEVYGATEYKIIIDDEQFAIIDNHIENNNLYEFDSEINGNMYVVASNNITDNSQSEEKSILSVPNSTEIKNTDIMYETNKYKISFSFDNNSDICDYYALQYSVDGNENIIIRIPNIYQNGEKVDYSFYCTDILENITLSLLPTNNTGSNNYTKEQKFITINDFSAWTYKKDLKQILLCWHDMLENEDNYLLRYRINRGEWNTLYIDKASGINNKMLEYIDMDETSIMDACLSAIIDGQPQVYTKSIRISKDLDTMLVPPIDFVGSRMEYGKLAFEWKDNGYDTSHSYELQVTDAITGKTSTITVPCEDDGEYHYEYLMDGYGYVTAKVRMVWELGESDYTDNVMVYNILVTYEAPPMNRQEHVDDYLKLSWKYYSYVQKYILYLSADGKEQQIETSDFEYSFKTPSNKKSVEIKARVQAVFIDGSSTNISDSLTFCVCSSEAELVSTVYTFAEIEYKDYTTIYNKDMMSLYDVYTLSTVKSEVKYPLYDKTIRDYIFSDYDLYQNTWQCGIGSRYRLDTTIKCSYLFLFDVNTTIYSTVNENVPVETIIKYPTSSSYPLHVKIDKVTICCLGDSITAGHPNYWAETGTGNEKSQYEYWLNRRLKNEFNVVNCGYGQEKTDDMLERFDRDVTSLQPRYVIILGGTNDWYQDASTKDLATGYTVMNGAIDNIKEMIKKAWDNNIYPIICTLTPRNDITEDGKILFDYFNDWVKEYSTQQSISGKECAYIDMFNAGKELEPPEPLEDPEKPYHLNPLYDGDNVYDKDGNRIRSGLGVHMNPDGYRVMGYSIPVNLFKTSNTGFKLYRDSSCQFEEKYNTEEASNPYYEIQVPNVRRGTEKTIIKYVKNVGITPTLYYIYVTDEYNMIHYLIDENGNRVQYLTGISNPNIKKKIELVIDTGFDDYNCRFRLHLLTRDLSSTIQ